MCVGLLLGSRRPDLGLHLVFCAIEFSVGAPAHLEVGGHTSRTVEQVGLRPSAVHLVSLAWTLALHWRLDHVA